METKEKVASQKRLYYNMENIPLRQIAFLPKIENG